MTPQAPNNRRRPGGRWPSSFPRSSRHSSRRCSPAAPPPPPDRARWASRRGGAFRWSTRSALLAAWPPASTTALRTSWSLLATTTGRCRSCRFSRHAGNHRVGVLGIAGIDHLDALDMFFGLLGLLGIEDHDHLMRRMAIFGDQLAHQRVARGGQAMALRRQQFWRVFNHVIAIDQNNLRFHARAYLPMRGCSPLFYYRARRRGCEHTRRSVAQQVGWPPLPLLE